MSGGEQRDWSIYPDFGSLLGAVMDERGITSDKDLAALARRHKPYNDLSDGRTIKNWKNGQGPGRSKRSREMVAQVRKALEIPDVVSPLGLFWEKRLTEVYEKASQPSAPPINNPKILDVKVVKSPETGGNISEAPPLPDDDSSSNFPGTSILISINTLKAISAGFRGYLTRKLVLTGAVIAVLTIGMSAWLIQKALFGRGEIPDNELHLSSSGFVLPSSSSELVTENALRGLNGWDSYVARNELFARHGKIFDTPCLDAHFRKYAKTAPVRGWYEPRDPTIGRSALNDIEDNNYSSIRNYEMKNFGHLYGCKKD